MENSKQVTHTAKKGLLVLMGAAAIASLGSFAMPAKPAFAASAGLSDHVQTEESTMKAGEAVNEVAGRADTIDFITLLAHKPLSAIVGKAASISDLDDDEVRAAIDAGRSLAEASGMGATELAAALRDAYAWELDRDVNLGILTRKQADAALQAAADLFEEAVTGPWKAVANGIFDTAGSDILNKRIANIVQDAAFWAEKSTIEVRQALREGQALKDAAVRDESDSDASDSEDDVTLTEYLVGLLEWDLDSAVHAGKLTVEESALYYLEGTEAIDRILGTAGYEPQTSDWMRQYGESLLDNRIDWVVMNTATLSDQDYGDVVDALSQGSNLVSASGMAESDLLAALSAYADEAIESAWRIGSITATLADELKQEAADRLKEAVRTAGYGTAASAAATSDPTVAEASLRRIVERSASYAELTADEVRDALKAGQTLVEATGVEHDELVMALQTSADAYINAAVADGTLARVAADLTKEEAGRLLEQAVETKGFVPSVDATAYVQERLAQVVADAAALADKPADELLLSLAQGRQLAAEVGTDNDDLLYKLLSDVNRELNAFVAGGSLTEEEGEQALSDYMKSLVVMLGFDADRE